MKISELVEKLEDIRAKEGDIEVGWQGKTGKTLYYADCFVFRPKDNLSVVVLNWARQGPSSGLDISGR